jgi:hypothetical protein
MSVVSGVAQVKLACRPWASGFTATMVTPYLRQPGLAQGHADDVPARLGLDHGEVLVDLDVVEHPPGERVRDPFAHVVLRKHHVVGADALQDVPCWRLIALAQMSGTSSSTSSEVVRMLAWMSVPIATSVRVNSATPSWRSASMSVAPPGAGLVLA